ncbi:sterol regulatory element-binding protein 1-like [Hydractinia symbiolongicarpus]|uniref:sterol regulatory element-binding protein 1-like n=1 Tax=Hydractinia symbiolongicarpus TaxID=13093 RepID=UPI00254FB3EE|nr:sterol regulatory element-binding protein 1-like [Hydractinia symbiolongicarpus]
MENLSIDVNMLSDINNSDFIDMLNEDQDFQDLFCDPQEPMPTETNLNIVNRQDALRSQSEFSLSSVEGFDQNFSASDTSLTDHNSPESLSYSPSYVPAYEVEYSPSTVSIDSGVPNSVDSGSLESPQLSPDSINASYSPIDLVDDCNNFSNVVSLNNYNEPEVTSQQDYLMRIINQQVQQALLQQQQQQKQQQQQQQSLPSIQQQQQQSLPSIQRQQQQSLPSIQQQQQLQQQRLLLAAQQRLLQGQNSQFVQDQVPVQDNIVSPVQTKNDSQLRKMLLQTKSNFAQTKNNIINTLQDKKEKISSFKFPKPNAKSNKRKLPANQQEGKQQKIPIYDENHPVSINEIQLSPGDKMEALLLQQPNTPVAPTLQGIKTNVYPAKVSSLNKRNSDNASDLTTIPTSSSSSINSVMQPLPKIPISRLKTNSNVTLFQPKSPKKQAAKRTRVEHVVIEKRYRTKISESLNELKIMLRHTDDKKATKNSILQAAIGEIKRLKRLNDSLSRKNKKMRKLFEELRSIGIIPSSQTVSSSGSESNTTEEASTESADALDMEPEVNQDHYASPFQRQSARDGAKLITCFTIFIFLFVNPLNILASKSGISSGGGSFSSRHLLSIGVEQDTSPQFYLVSNIINLVMSFFILMFMFLRGNPRCKKSSKLMQCFHSQLQKAQKKINKHEYEDAKGFVRIALFVIGNSCPKTFYGQLPSFLWKCCCHILYQLGIFTAMQSIGRSILPSKLSLATDKEEEEFVAKLSAEAYKKLHEIALKDPSSSYLEAACYLMNSIYAAEVSGDHELLCTAYATAVIHMKEKAWASCILQYYFLGCAHHVSLASKANYPFAVDWIFENRGYEYFAKGSWDVKQSSMFHVRDEDSELDEADLLQLVFAQFQEFLMMKAIRRIVVPETYYPNEGKIELRQRALSFLDSLGTGPVSEHLDSVSIHHHSVYGWWGTAFKNLLYVFKHGKLQNDELGLLNDMFEDIDERHRHSYISMTKFVIDGYISAQNVKHMTSNMKLLPTEVEECCYDINAKLLYASHVIERTRSVNAADCKSEMHELLLLMCCSLMVEARFTLWQIDNKRSTSEHELDLLTQQNELLQTHATKYLQLGQKVRQHELLIQSMSGMNQSELGHVMKRTNHIKSFLPKKDELNGIYYDGKHSSPR